VTQKDGMSDALCATSLEPTLKIISAKSAPPLQEWHNDIFKAIQVIGLHKPRSRSVTGGIRRREK
jgi:hypothetical protein